MRRKSVPAKEPATQVVKNIRRATRRHFSAEDKIRIVLEGLRGENSIAELCRREGIVQNLYYRWSKDFLEEPLVRSLPGWWAGSPGRPTSQTRSRLEPHSRRCSRAHHQAGAGRVRLVAEGIGRAAHRHRRLFCLGGFGLSATQGPRSDRQPSLHRDEGRGRVQG